MRLVALVLITAFLGIAVPAFAQPSALPPVSGGGGTTETGYFSIVVDPDEYPDAEDGETEDIRFVSLQTAYCLIHGIEWWTDPEDKDIVIDKRLFSIIRDLELEDISEFGECYRYTYSYLYVVEELDKQKVGKVIWAIGESDEENMGIAWREARESAFVDAVKQALDRKYTDNQLGIPNNLRGMITVYEIMYDDYNYVDEVYRFEINAWVGYEPRMQEF